MKFNILISILMAFCAVQVTNAGPLDSLQQQLKKSKSKVDSILSDLKRTKSNLDSNTRTKINNLKLQSMQNINDAVNRALSQVRSDVDAAKAEGKDAENCYDTAKDKLRTISKNAFASLDEADNSIRQSLNTALNRLDTPQSTGNELINELDRVFLDCYSSNIIQMQSCIALKMGSINMSIRTYENTVSSTKSEVQRAANDLETGAYSKFSPISSKALSETTNVRLSTNECLRNA